MHSIEVAAQAMGAVAYAPAQWGDVDSDAYAVVVSPHHCTVMVRTDGETVEAYKYASPRGVARSAEDIMPTLVTVEGNSIDPTYSTSVTVTDGDIVAAVRRAVRYALMEA